MSEARVHKGGLVTFRIGTRCVQGEVKEDRGPIGVKGRHLYLVEFRPKSESTDVSQIELPADQLQAVQDAASVQ